MEFITAELITFLITILGGMILGSAVMGCILIYVCNNHDVHLNALNKEQRDSNVLYNNRIKDYQETISKLELKLQQQHRECATCPAVLSRGEEHSKYCPYGIAIREVTEKRAEEFNKLTKKFPSMDEYAQRNLK